jgi:hypothetical protein
MFLIANKIGELLERYDKYLAKSWGIQGEKVLSAALVDYHQEFSKNGESCPGEEAPLKV